MKLINIDWNCLDDVKKRWYYTFKWNLTIDEKFLLDIKRKLVYIHKDETEKAKEKETNKDNDSIDTHHSNYAYYEEKENFELLLKQWVRYPTEEMKPELLFTKNPVIYVQTR